MGVRARPYGRAGCELNAPVLVSDGFQFRLRDAALSSGGHFAWGEYVRGDRRLALPVRASLGLVTYHLDDLQVPHEAFVRTVHGASGGNAFPRFLTTLSMGFRHLRHDLERIAFRAADPSSEPVPDRPPTETTFRVLPRASADGLLTPAGTGSRPSQFR